MKKLIRENWKFLLFVAFSGLIGGYCAGLYLPETFSEEMLQQLKQQNVSPMMLAVSTAIQYGLLYGLLLALAGVYLSKKVFLWKRFRFEKSALKETGIVALVSALLLYPGDLLLFGTFSGWVKEQYQNAPGLMKILSGLLVGGVIEEVMMRLFFMSLLVLLLSKLFHAKENDIPSSVFFAANLISALLFAAGHIPSTAAMTQVTGLLLLRCFLFNGGLGLCFGYLYRKHGIGYAMMAHGFAHLFSDLLMLLLI